jgi:hypothetical protein
MVVARWSVGCSGRVRKRVTNENVVTSDHHQVIKNLDSHAKNLGLYFQWVEIPKESIQPRRDITCILLNTRTNL